MSTISPASDTRAKAARLQWSPTGLRVPVDMAQSEVARQTLSVSSAKAIRSCPSRWAAEKIFQLPDDLMAPNVLGNAGHETLEPLFQLPPEQRTQDRAAELLGEVAGHWQAGTAMDGARSTFHFPQLSDESIRLRFTAEAWAGISKLWEIEDPTTVDVWATEFEVKDQTVGGVPFGGYIDRVDRVIDKNGNPALRLVDYKGLAIDTPIPTPHGWTTMGDLAVGDEVMGTSGLPAKVTVKSRTHHRPCYRITFSDRSQIVCDNVHLWQIVDATTKKLSESFTINADDLYELYSKRVAEGYSRSLVIPNAQPMQFDDAELPIDPYLLGVWLGDGKTNGGSITVGRSDADGMIPLLEDAWYGCVTVEPATRTQGTALTVLPAKKFAGECPAVHRCGFREWKNKEGYVSRSCPECGRRRSAAHYRGQAYKPQADDGTRNVSLQTLLREQGLLGNKHVPAVYLRGSIDQRVALLQGLMDSDGSWNPKRRRAVFTTTSEKLAFAVRELVNSLGVSVQFWSGEYSNKKRPDATHFMLEFSPVGFNPFRLPRKAEGAEACDISSSSRIRSTRRTIVSMEAVDSVPTQCIQVDAEDSLYLAGPTMVPTHNTGRYVDQSSRNRFGDDHGDQLRLYATGLEQMLAVLPEGHPDRGLKVTEAYAYYTKHGKTAKVALSAPYRKKTIVAHAQAWAKHQEITTTGQFPAKDSALCTFCPLVRQCPFRSEKINWPRVKDSALRVSDAPILGPVSDYVQQRMTLPDQWDAALDEQEAAAQVLLDWAEQAAGEDTEQPAPTGVPTFRLEVPDVLNPFARIDDGIYTPALNPFAPQGPQTPTAVHPAGELTPTTIHTPTHQEEPVTTTQNTPTAGAPFFEDKATVADPNNIGSYAHLSANGIVNTALRQIRLAGVPATQVSPALISAVSDVLWTVVTTVQQQAIGSRDLQSALARNLFRSLAEVLALNPMPILTGPDGSRRFATAEEINMWGVNAIAQVGTLLTLSVGMVHNGGNQNAAAAFRGTPVDAPAPGAAATGQTGPSPQPGVFRPGFAPGETDPDDYGDTDSFDGAFAV